MFVTNITKKYWLVEYNVLGHKYCLIVGSTIFNLKFISKLVYDSIWSTPLN